MSFYLQLMLKKHNIGILPTCLCCTYIGFQKLFRFGNNAMPAEEVSITVLGLFPTGLFPLDFSPLCPFSTSCFIRQVFSQPVFLRQVSPPFFSPSGIFPVIFIKQGNQPNQIKPSQTKRKPNLTMSNLTQPNLTKSNQTKPYLSNQF